MRKRGRTTYRLSSHEEPHDLNDEGEKAMTKNTLNSLPPAPPPLSFFFPAFWVLLS